MAATLMPQFSLGQDIAFIQRMQSAILAYALTIESEAGTVTNHAQRLALANRVVQSPQLYAQQFAVLAAVGSAQIGTDDTAVSPPNSANVTDADITGVVAAGWNLVPGV
jgi:hypothetical protein